MAIEVVPWIVQLNSKTGAAVARSCRDEPCYTVTCSGLGSMMDGPYGLVWLPDGFDPSGRDWASVMAAAAPVSR